VSDRERRKARQTAEESRQTEWEANSFLKNLFLGDFTPDQIFPYPAFEGTKEFQDFFQQMEQFLRDKVNPVEIDESGEYPREVVDGLAELGAFGMKIDKEYGGLGLTHSEYVQVMKLVGSHDANVTALLSAHQAIGVPQPVKLFGTEEQKQKFLPRCAKGSISAFALTEPAVGSDPAKLETTAQPTEDGSHYILDGQKLWCTNGTLADLIVVMARNPKTDQINAFVVEMDWPGVEVTHRCRFLGLRALANAQVRFEGVEVPAENLVGDKGAGLRIALTTLNTGRLTLPAATAGVAKQCLEIARKWSCARKQWGVPIGKHEAVAHKISEIASVTFAMEAVAELVGDFADRPDFDIRLEAAAAKEWNTVRCWELIDDTLQLRGGRGYETERSLEARGEPAVGLDRFMRDARINLIFEGSSEIMHLFIAREAVDEHLKVAGKLVEPDASLPEKMKALPNIAAFYSRWYPEKYLGWGRWPAFKEYGPLASHVRFIERSSRRLARQLFHAMAIYQAGLEKKQALMFRAVDIGLELFALSASVSRAQRLRSENCSEAESALKLVDLFGRRTKRKVNDLFRGFWKNEDARRYRLAREVMDGEFTWLEKGTLGLPYSTEDLKPKVMAEILS